jgi:branched-subunit amino acid ABC-type transport system permease component
LASPLLLYFTVTRTRVGMLIRAGATTPEMVVRARRRRRSGCS